MKYESSDKIISKEKYLDLFSDENKVTNKKKQKKALEYALDIRKFEIELYWKRGTYFWTFIAIAFTSYFIVLNIETAKTGISSELKNELIFLLNLFGLFLSTSWFFVNKGSKYWQENWEKHVDLLEDKIIGPLYKTTVSKRGKLDRFSPHKSYPYSVGKINQLISFVVVFLWLFLLVRFLEEKLSFSFSYIFSSYTIMGAFFIFFFILLFCMAESSRTNGKELNMKKRVIK